LIKLKNLGLAGNQITKIENVSKLTNLLILDLGFNQITKITNLDNLSNLRLLILKENPIKDPITTLEKYREYIKTVKIPYELEWCDYYMIIAIINENYINIYKMYA
jgi:Leucine Rich repeats (2 copies)